MSGKLYPSSENNHNLSSFVSSPTQSVETDADRLMDDLFSDIDRILDGGSRLPSEPIHPDYIALKSVVVPPIIMPPSANESALIAQNNLDPANGGNNFPPRYTIKNYLGKDLQEKGWGTYLDKILFILACLSLVGVVGWLIYQKKIPLPFLAQNNPQSVANNSTEISPEDQQFIAYMLRSLEVIDSETVNLPSPTPTTIPNIPSNLNIPPIANPSNSNQPQTVIERIYIPYPSDQNPQNNNNSSTLPAPAPPALPTPKTSIPAPPTAVTPTPLPLPTPQNNPSLEFNVPPPPLPGVSHTLVGLLESGDNSAALFDINGSTQRVKVGEQIGTSGWALVSVASQQAVIRRNGEVRSIYVGQKF